MKSLEERITELEEKMSRLEALIPDETMKKDFWEKACEKIRQGLTPRSANHDTSEEDRACSAHRRGRFAWKAGPPRQGYGNQGQADDPGGTVPECLKGLLRPLRANGHTLKNLENLLTCGQLLSRPYYHMSEKGASRK